MNLSFSFIQVLFSALSVIFSIGFITRFLEGGFNGINLAVGILTGGIIAAFFVSLDHFFKQFSFKSFNIGAIGLFFGYLMATAILFLLAGILQADLNSESMLPVRFFTYLICSYLGLTLVNRADQEFHLSIPFFEFKKNENKKKDILVDVSILNDSRIVDLATTGLLDQQLIFPRFAIKKLHSQAEMGDETEKVKARRSLDILKKLESIPSLDPRFVEKDFEEIKDPMLKLIDLARTLDTHIITSDINRIQQSSVEGIRFINIHMLSNALKPVTQNGEVINIKIQRYGKEPRQGVGYLEDGTMVVVNGGAEFIGESIKAYVLSVKHTSSGRMIFCNASEEEGFVNEEDYFSNETKSPNLAPSHSVAF